MQTGLGPEQDQMAGWTIHVRSLHMTICRLLNLSKSEHVLKSMIHWVANHYYKP
jgi:hypothetical protein